MKQSRSVVLRAEDRPDGSTLRLWARLDPDGSLILVAQDLGPVTSVISDDGEYEYGYKVDPADVGALLAALGAPGGVEVLDYLVEHWSGDASYALEKSVSASGVRHRFWTW